MIVVFFLPGVSLFVLFLLCVFGVYSVVCFELSVSVQVIA